MSETHPTWRTQGAEKEGSNHKVHSLTRAHLELLQACLNHDTTNNEELASLNHLSPHTVTTHFREITRRLGVTNRFAAVIIALKTGWITLPSVGAALAGGDSGESESERKRPPPP